MSLKMIAVNLINKAFGERIRTDLESLGEVVPLTDTSYLVETELSTTQILTKLMKDVSLEDDVYVVELARSWSAYGDVSVNRFLDSHCRA